MLERSERVELSPIESDIYLSFIYSFDLLKYSREFKDDGRPMKSKMYLQAVLEVNKHVGIHCVGEKRARRVISDRDLCRSVQSLSLFSLLF